MRIPPRIGLIYRRGQVGNGLGVSAPVSIAFNDGDQPYNMAGAEKIVLSDAGSGDTTYTVGIEVGGGGTLTLSGTTGLTGAGSGTSSLSYSGSIANWNAALDGADIAGLSGETVNIVVTMTGDTTSRVAVGSISVTSTTVGGSTDYYHDFSNANNSMYAMLTV